MRRPKYEESMEWFATAVPELAPLLAEHLADQGEVLPYVLFEDNYMGWFKTKALADPTNPSVTRFLECVEVLLDGPADEASNLAFIGFVEHLVAGGEDAVLMQLSGRFGPATEAAFEEFRSDQVRLGELRREFGMCRCRDLDEVLGAATSFYRQHLVWIDVIQTGLERSCNVPRPVCGGRAATPDSAGRSRCVATLTRRPLSKRFVPRFEAAEPRVRLLLQGGSRTRKASRKLGCALSTGVSGS